MKTSLFSIWMRRFRTMVRYRLLVLTSFPIFMTLLALVGITIYWSVSYTWQNALNQINANLSVANNSIEILQREQRNHLTALVDSYDFQDLLRKDRAALNLWVGRQAQKYNLDYVVLHPSQDIELFSAQSRERLLAGEELTFFQVVGETELDSLSPSLRRQAQVPILKTGGVESRGLLSRSVIPLFDQYGRLKWIADGGILLNNSTVLVDRIRDLVYPNHTLPEGSIGTVTLFLDDLRVSTNVPLDSEGTSGRAIGTRVSPSVQQQVLQDGTPWIDRAYVYDAWYISGYKPLKNDQNNVIGMLYTGYLEWPFIETYLINIIEIGLMVVVVLIISGVFVYRGARDLFDPIERIHHVVKSVQIGRDKRIGELGLDSQHELASLAYQFDNMLDQLSMRNAEIRQAASELESKVERRTASLHEKTEQLELHIRLLQQTRDKLVTNEKLAALGELTAGIAHEINNPTAVILGNVELMKFELGEGVKPVEEEINAILEQIDRIRNITRSLLQYSRHGGIQDEVTWQHVNPIVEESITLVRSGTKKKQIQITSDLQAQCNVEVNRHQLLQILVNLQMNGVHAMSGEGELRISSRDWIEDESPIGAIVSVQDFGCGIKEENLKRIFDPFYTTKREGTGLGLSVSQSLLSQIGGEIKVSSEEGVGTCFSVYLPLKAESDIDINLLASIS
ncbi:cache domain-containing protein [Vibrio sp. Of7-15]|uniref:sensor histidine kinase n=1 Tax=Vibrio sp. Of7-15 TaxID=2724879 RepID=UPI001EF1E58D|nr:HAMP domain-containing sensor histidine kinase [Vibrio sp. Of7-15]MCG7496380.1 cache domain-containing protein [Vibrio sp. Of7-15]